MVKNSIPQLNSCIVKQYHNSTKHELGGKNDIPQLNNWIIRLLHKHTYIYTHI